MMIPATASGVPQDAPARLSPNIVALGVVSLLMGMSSAMIYGLLPIFLVTVLGASMASVGIIEGLAEATTSLTKIFSGITSDWIGRRKPLVLLGYGLSAGACNWELGASSWLPPISCWRGPTTLG